MFDKIRQERLMIYPEIGFMLMWFVSCFSAGKIRETEGAEAEIFHCN